VLASHCAGIGPRTRCLHWFLFLTFSALKQQLLPPLDMAAADVIIPPPEIKAIVDKTADFVAKHGPALEQKILGREAGVKKFEFLLATSVYHAYYRAKVTECSGGASAVAPVPSVAEVAQENVARRASATAGMISKAADVKEVAPKRALVEPPKDSFIADYPDGIIISGCDMDVIKMTAQFVARNGKAFLNQLSTREARNPQFQFLRSDHLLFSFFTSLVEQYAHVCHPSPALLAALQKNVDAPAQLLERALQKLDWTLHLESEEAARAAQDEAEAQASAAIDWHDFNIVETLVFEDAELRGLSHPMSQPELLAFVKATQASAVSAVSQHQQQQQGAAGDGDEDMDMDMETDDKPSAAPVSATGAPANILPSYSRPTAASTASSAQ
jgi:splicing factor 3A subunit 1